MKVMVLGLLAGAVLIVLAYLVMWTPVVWLLLLISSVLAVGR